MNRPSWIGYTLGGRYVIEALLGQGGMSAVYRANDPNLRRPVAIKLIHSHLSADPEFISRFEGEAAAVAQLRHPNIVQVFDFNHDGDTYYMVMEYLPGETLQERLKALSAVKQRFPISTTASILAMVADAVAYAHERGTIHRDLKPANVMLTPQGQPVLTDFGVAKILGGQRHTATGAVIGTPAYMSPEQVRGEALDGRADIYSLGIMLYEMTAGQPPFEGNSAMTVMLKHVNEPVPDIRRQVTDIPEGMVAIIDKALAKQPDQRFQSASQMAAALRAVAQAAGQPAKAAADQPSPTLVEAPPTLLATAAQAAPPRQTPPPRQAPPAQGTQVSATPPPPSLTTTTGSRSATGKPNRMTLVVVGAIVLVLCLALGGLGAFAASRYLFPAATATVIQPPTSLARPTLAETSSVATVSVPPAETATAEATLEATLAATQEPTVADTAPPSQEPSPTDTPQPTAPPIPQGMVLAPAGTFNMGSTAFPDTQPVHAVTLDAFYIDQFEVVNDLYHQCVTAGNCTDPARRSSDTRGKYYDDPAFGGFPVVNVTWQQAQNFCQWQGKRLPTEAEWEYAATGGSGHAYPWGDQFDASLVPVNAHDTQQVGSVPNNASPFGAEDMAGNVTEWTGDWYAPDYYANSPANNPTGPATGTRGVLRGGAYGNPDPKIYLAARRSSHSPNFGDVDIGFRCAMPAPK